MRLIISQDTNDAATKVRIIIADSAETLPSDARYSADLVIVKADGGRYRILKHRNGLAVPSATKSQIASVILKELLK